MSTPMSTKYPMSTQYPMRAHNNALLLEYLSICSPQATGNNSGRRNLNRTKDVALFVGEADSKVPAGAAARHRGNVSAKELRDNFHLPLHTVAKKFGMCTTAFKKLCRRFEIPKWPHRQVIISRGLVEASKLLSRGRVYRLARTCCMYRLSQMQSVFGILVRGSVQTQTDRQTIDPSLTGFLVGICGRIHM